MKGTDKRVYVIHWTEDMATGEELAGGQRYKDVTGLAYEGSMRCGAWTSIIGKP